MKELQVLLHRYWVIKTQAPELYYQIKNQMKPINKIIQEKFGYTIIVNPSLIKLEKIPGYSEPWMGIQEFQYVQEYQMLCYMLIYLEDKEVEQQFVLSDITEFIKMQFVQETVDWTVYTTRRQLVRVIKYCLEMGMLKQTDGEGDSFARDMNTEVLYENTGISKYFLRHFSIDIMQYKTPEDFKSSSWFDADEDRGLVRRHRIYRRLLLSPGVYRNDEMNDDFGYIRNYRSQIEKDFNMIFPCHFDVHMSSAYIVLDELKSMGKIFPRTFAQEETMLYIFGILQTYIKKQSITMDEQYILDKKEIVKVLMNKIKQIYQYLPKKYQDKGEELVIRDLLETMHLLGFIKQEEEQILVYPIIGKIKGSF